MNVPSSYYTHRKIAWTVMAGLLFFVALFSESQTMWFISWVCMWVCVLCASILPNEEAPKRKRKQKKGTTYWEQEVMRSQQEEINQHTSPDSIWPDAWMDFKPDDKKWFMEQMWIAGYEFDQYGEKAPHLKDLGKPFPHELFEEPQRTYTCHICRDKRLHEDGFDVLNGNHLVCPACSDNVTLMKAWECKHTGKVETTNFSDKSRTFVCTDCGTQLGYSAPESLDDYHAQRPPTGGSGQTKGQ